MPSSMFSEEILSKLKSLGNEKVRTLNIRNGAGENQFGVKLGDIRSLAKSIKPDKQLVMSLWETGNLDARLLAILIMNPKEFSVGEVDDLVRSIDSAQLAEWLSSYLIKDHPDNEQLRI